MQLNFVVPGSIKQISGGYIYDRKIVNGLRKRGLSIRVSELSGTFPIVDSNAKNVAEKCLSDDSITIIDGLALPAFSDLLPLKQKVIALVHHPLFEETGLTIEEINFLRQQENNNLQKVNHIIVTSEFTRQNLVKHFQVKQNNISVVIPGNEILPLFKGSSQENIHFLAVGSIIPRKGYDVLLKALAPISNLPWTLNCIGSTKNYEETKKIKDIVLQHNLFQKINFLGELEEEKVNDWYQKSDVFVSASHHEGFGMAISEARSCGMPIVATTGGAVSKILNNSNALLSPPGDIEALSQNLKNIIVSAKLRTQLRDQSIIYRNTLKSWDDMAKIFEEKLLIDEISL